ncbi:MAG: hypothetical protein ACTSP4_11520 [Candidatus Hodarchaeales archaeon]
MAEKRKLGKDDYDKLEGKDLMGIAREKFKTDPPLPQVNITDPYDINILEILGDNRSLHQVQLMGQLKQFIGDFDVNKAALTMLKLENLGHVTVVNDFWKLTPKGRDFLDYL